MKLKVLGCSGSIGQGLRTTALLLDDAVLLDAGTGVGDLPVATLCALQAAFITHAHLDHVACLPMLADLRSMRHAPALAVHALPETLQALRTHLFNGLIWPDFTRIPAEAPALVLHALNGAAPIHAAGLSVAPLPVQHSVPAVGYRVMGARGEALAFSGDTGPAPALWQALRERDVDVLILDTAFEDGEAALARQSRHYHPAQLAQDLAAYGGRARIYITHTKPGEGEQVAAQLRAQLPQRPVALLHEGLELLF